MLADEGRLDVFQPNEVHQTRASNPQDFVSDQPSSLDDQLRASEQRRSALEEEVRRKDEFLATLSHELRSPLGAIRHALGVLQPALAAEPTLAWAAGVIERQVRDLCRLTDDLLDLSRIAEGKTRFETEAVDLARIIEHAIEASYPLLERRGQRLRVDLPPRPLELWGDGSRLVQVFTNLLNNASTYSGEGTHVAVGVEEERDEVIVRIRDGGIGLSAEVLPRVFEPFFQADPARAGRHGLGVGLHLVRQFVQMHGGIVSASSGGVGQGTEFVVRLPLIRPPAAEAQPPGPPVTSKKGMAMDDIGERPEDMRYTGPPLGILVIDDHEDGGSMFGLLLRSMGHDAKVMTSAANLLAEARAFQPDAIFLDLSMPGIDGYEAARTLRQEADLKNVYLVAHSAYGRAEDIEDCRNAGFDVHLLKPTRADRLQSVIAEVARRV